MQSSYEGGLKIFFVIPSMTLGGAETFMRDLCSALSGSGHGLALASGGGELLDTIEGVGVRIHRLPALAKNFFTALAWTRIIRKKLIEGDYDIVCASSILTAMILYVATFGLASPKKAMILHNPLRPWYLKALAAFSRFGLDLIISVSNRNMKVLLDLGVPGAKITHIPNGIHTERFPYSERSTHVCSGRIGTVARLEEYKGHKYLIDAVRLVEKERGRKLQLHFYGDGPYREELQKYVNERKPESTITFHGTTRDVAAALENLDLFVLPSCVEAFPISILEAMSSGVPVIATPIGDTATIIEDGRSGILIEPRSPEAIKEAILKILDDPEFYRSLQLAARHQVEEKYSFQSVSNKYEETFSNILGSNRS